MASCTRGVKGEGIEQPNWEEKNLYLGIGSVSTRFSSAKDHYRRALRYMGCRHQEAGRVKPRLVGTPGNAGDLVWEMRGAQRGLRWCFSPIGEGRRSASKDDAHTFGLSWFEIARRGLELEPSGRTRHEFGMAIYSRGRREAVALGLGKVCFLFFFSILGS